MKEMKTIYQVGGKLCKDFIGQISYTVCLDQTYEELDIEFSFGPQHFRPEDVTPELKQRLLDYCKKEYGIEEPTPEEWEDAVYHGMKTEIHTMATLNDTFIGNQILDLLRRRLFGLQLTDSCITFRPGHDRPLLVVSEAARSRGNTVRFSLRRRTPPTRDADHTADFEPMLDFDRPAPVSPPSFPQPEQSAAPDPAAPHRTLHRRDTAATPPEVSEPTGVIRFETDADAQAAAPEPVQTSGPEAPRHARIRRARPVEPPAPADEAPLPDVPQGRAPAPSVLDDDIPDFSADLDPAAIAAAQAADDAAEAAGKSASVEDFTRAATQLFDASAIEEAAREKAKPRKKRKKNADSDADLPPKQPAPPSIKNRSLEIIEKSERRRRRTVILGLVVLALVLVLVLRREEAHCGRETRTEYLQPNYGETGGFRVSFAPSNETIIPYRYWLIEGCVSEIDYNIVPGRRMSLRTAKQGQMLYPAGFFDLAFEDVQQYEIDGVTVTQRQNAGRITGISWARDGYEYLLYSMQPEMNMVVGLAVEFVTNTRAEPMV